MTDDIKAIHSIVEEYELQSVITRLQNVIADNDRKGLPGIVSDLNKDIDELKIDKEKLYDSIEKLRSDIEDKATFIDAQYNIIEEIRQQIFIKDIKDLRNTLKRVKAIIGDIEDYNSGMAIKVKDIGKRYR